MESLIEGELTSMGPEGFAGWAWDSSRPYESVEVELLGNDAVLATVVADGFSLDLVKQRKGNGMHMFTALPTSLSTATYPLQVSARIKGQTNLLPGAITIRSVSELIDVLPRSLFHNFKGFVDSVRDGAVVGWVVNASFPDEAVEVELLEGNIVIARAMTSHYRGDVAQQYPERPESGFELPLPYGLLDGEMHSLNVRVAGTSHELGNSPLIIGTGSATALIKEVVQLRERLEATQAREQELTAALLARFEALLSIQRDSFEREIQAIRTAVLGLPRLSEAASLPPVVSARQHQSKSDVRSRSHPVALSPEPEQAAFATEGNEGGVLTEATSRIAANRRQGG